MSRSSRKSRGQSQGNQIRGKGWKLNNLQFSVGFHLRMDHHYPLLVVRADCNEDGVDTMCDLAHPVVFL